MRTWAALAALIPSVPQPAGPSAGGGGTDLPVTFCREKNGWCLDSARLWLALEIKGIPYTERRVIASDAPQLLFSDGRVQRDSIAALQELDSCYPATAPLWPPQGVAESAVVEMVSAYADAVPSDVSRASSRAAFLFCRDEGFIYDTLPRETFISFLDTAEELLGRQEGPYFCGGALSAADVAWAPLLERYAAQLPSLHPGLQPRGGSTSGGGKGGGGKGGGGKGGGGSSSWPRLTRWYNAMDTHAAYVCRVKGDAASWRKVLSTSPWWPAGWPERGDPEERGDPRGGELALNEREACEAFGNAPVSAELWSEYAASRPHVAPSPAAEAAAALVRNAQAVCRDAEACYALPTGTDTASYDAALRCVVTRLLIESGAELEEASAEELGQDAVVAALAAHLDHRVCVPRDVGAPAAEAIRRLARSTTSDAQDSFSTSATRAATVNRF